MMDDMDLSEDDDSEEEQASDGDSPLIRDVIEFCGGPDLIEVFGGSGSGKSEFSTQVVRSAIQDAGKSALVIDTERNIGDMEQIAGADYVYIPEWHDIYAYITGKTHKLSDNPFGENTTGSQSIEDGYDVVILDSIGFPALIQYGEYRVDDDAEQFKVFNELQVITGRLKKYAQYNNALVIVTNQPKSDLSAEDDPNPFGDKSIYGFKEIWKTEKASSSEIKTTCNINAFRSRQAGKGKRLFKMEVEDSGTTITQVDEDSESDEWSV